MNNLEGKVPPEIGQCTSLVRLDLSRNGEYKEYGHVYNKGLKGFTGTLPDPICELTKLQVLDISENKFLGLLPLNFGKLVNLKVLDLAFNSFWGVVPPSFQQLENLAQCYLNHNRLSGVLPLLLIDMKVNGCTVKLNSNKGFLLPDNLDEIKMKKKKAKLTTLDLSECSLSGKFPWEAVSKLPDLEMLVMYGNVFQGNAFEEMPDTEELNVPFMQKLKRMDLRKSNFRVSQNDKETLKDRFSHCRLYF